METDKIEIFLLLVIFLLIQKDVKNMSNVSITQAHKIEFSLYDVLKQEVPLQYLLKTSFSALIQLSVPAVPLTEKQKVNKLFRNKHNVVVFCADHIIHVNYVVEQAKVVGTIFSYLTLKLFVL